MTAIMLTFDFDAESPWLQNDVADHARDLTQLSWGAFGARRGIVRILDLLDELDIRATFFVPGWTADAHPDRVRAVHERGHEVALHGYHHVPPVAFSAEEQRHDFVRGMEALARCTGVAPVGYRSPAWQLTPVTMTLLAEFGFVYDSSCMGDDRPYRERHGDREILELPVHWTLDDFPHLAWMPQYTGPLRGAADLISAWRPEVEAALRDDRPLVLTCHPEVVGRAGPMESLATFVAELCKDHRVEFARCVDVARASSTTG
jgi:peptidoglycan/xylan/chitin deacetylase (PgdA/CDA1 family)